MIPDISLGSHFSAVLVMHKWITKYIFEMHKSYFSFTPTVVSNFLSYSDISIFVAIFNISCNWSPVQHQDITHILAS